MKVLKNIKADSGQIGSTSMSAGGVTIPEVQINDGNFNEIASTNANINALESANVNSALIQSTDLVSDNINTQNVTSNRVNTTELFVDGIQIIPPIIGTTGAQGDPGVPGAQGDAGAQGPVGPAGGSQGPLGPQGNTGPQGPVGPIGPQGGMGGPTGPTGIQGAQGVQGEQGVVGPIGPQGDQGNQGDQGIQGLQGIDGPTGPTGFTGQQGDKGDQGIQGIQGLIGADGPTGFTGQKGDKGDQGIQGLIGNPGPVGPDGPQGPQGIQGVQGPQGEVGPTGFTGQQGEQGVAGPTGHTGPAGSTNIVYDYIIGTDQTLEDNKPVYLDAEYNAYSTEQYSDYVLKGDEITGTFRNFFGERTSINGDGTVIAFGGNKVSRVYEWNGNDWVQRGPEFTGSLAEMVVSLNSDGTILAITDTESDNICNVLYWDTSTSPPAWVQIGSTIHANVDIYSMSLNSNGNILVIGHTSKVSVYELDTSTSPHTWVQRGNDISSNNVQNYVSINNDGDIISFGSSNIAKVYEWDAVASPPAWVQKGGDFIFTNGYVITSLSSDGNELAISNIPSITSAITKVYKWDAVASPPAWVQKGSDKDGGGSALSGDGGKLAVSVRKYNTITYLSSNYVEYYNTVKLYNWDASVLPPAWVEIGHIEGLRLTPFGDIFGSWMEFDSNGTNIVIGARNYSVISGGIQYAPYGDTIGRVSVYKQSSSFAGIATNTSNNIVSVLQTGTVKLYVDTYVDIGPLPQYIRPNGTEWEYTLVKRSDSVGVVIDTDGSTYYLVTFFPR